jgi:hypothetical protein
MSNGGTTAAGAVTSAPHDSYWDHPVAITVAAVAGAAALFGILYLAGGFAVADTGDEPPIRVKNGSVDFYLATSKDRWNQGADTKHWKISGGKRAKDQLDVVIAVNAGAICNAQSGTGDQVTLVYDNGNGTTTNISIATDPENPKQKHSGVFGAELKLSTVLLDKNRLLTYGDPTNQKGYISRILLDDGNPPMCTFTDRKQLAELVIMDY